jgi:hypothetical protein
MRPWIVALGSIISLIVVSCTPPAPPPMPTPTPGPPSICDSSLWSHVYHPYRLHLISQCVTVVGTVLVVRLEADGDAHIVILPNDTVKYGSSLVTEAICNYNHISQKDAIAPCAGLTQHLVLPHAGDRVSIIGSQVEDVDHGWMEIHPITSIQIQEGL